MKDLSINISILKSWRYHEHPVHPYKLRSVETGQQVSTNSYLTQRSRSFLPILARYWQSTDMDRGERGGGKRETIFLPLPVHIRSEHVWCNYWKTSIFNRPLENWFLWSRVTRRGFNLIRGGYLPWNLRLANNIEGLIFWTIVEKSVGGTDLSFFLPFGWLFHGFSSLSKHGDCSQIGKGGRYVSSCYQL